MENNKHVYIILADVEGKTGLFERTPVTIIYAKAVTGVEAVGMVLRVYRQNGISLTIREVVSIGDEIILKDIVTLQ